MTDALVCWKCGASLADLPRNFARLEACAACGSDLHVCRLCAFYDPHRAKACREPVADEVKEKTRANFCGYFQPRPGAWQAADEREAQAARAALADLFDAPERPGAASATGEEAGTRAALDRLFGLNEE